MVMSHDVEKRLQECNDAYPSGDLPLEVELMVYSVDREIKEFYEAAYAVLNHYVR
jgi:hypothetical protein